MGQHNICVYWFSYPANISKSCVGAVEELYRVLRENTLQEIIHVATYDDNVVIR